MLPYAAVDNLETQTTSQDYHIKGSKLGQSPITKIEPEGVFETNQNMKEETMRIKTEGRTSEDI